MTSCAWSLKAAEFGATTRYEASATTTATMVGTASTVAIMEYMKTSIFPTVRSALARIGKGSALPGRIGSDVLSTSLEHNAYVLQDDLMGGKAKHVDKQMCVRH
jgi:hypothetical protein